jgi:hypothetical protein
MVEPPRRPHAYGLYSPLSFGVDIGARQFLRRNFGANE